jgi:hypothetical protein
MNKATKKELLDALDNIYALVDKVVKISGADNRLLEAINSEVREIFRDHNLR